MGVVILIGRDTFLELEEERVLNWMWRMLWRTEREPGVCCNFVIPTVEVRIGRKLSCV